MLKIQSDRVIIDGHEPTKEQCETMTLLANALVKSESFRTVKYESGYAEFEKIGKADELKFVLDGPGSFSMYDTSTADEVLYVSSDSTSLAITFSGNELTLTAEGDFMFTIKRSNSSYVESYSPSDGSGALNIPVIVKMKKQIENIDGYNIKFGEVSATPRKSVDLTTLSGWSSLSSGSHNITIVAKADGYRDSEPSAAVSVTKGAAMPTKGDLINIDSKQYRVLKTEGTVAEVLATYAAIVQPFGTTKTYANSDADTYCNTTFYNTLSKDMQNAIVTKTFIQDKWYGGGVIGGELDEGTGSGDPKYNGTYDWFDGDDWYTESYIVSLSNAQYGEAILRKIYLLSVQDIIDYLNVTSNMTASNTTLTGNNLHDLFGMTSEDILLSSAPANTYYENGQILVSIASGGQYFIDRSGVANKRTIYPAFQIDLSKIAWSK